MATGKLFVTENLFATSSGERGDGLFSKGHTKSDCRFTEKVRDPKMRSPALRVSALPGTVLQRVVTIISSCLRPRLRTPHRPRRLRPAYRGQRLLRRRRAVALQVRVADPDVDRLALRPVCKGRR